ncbi:GYD domain-containing protein [Tranquillimonas alkanivorans]|uniref:Uncharacterized protein, contains GYD domain n=1 Tax=Tranquillimonas alkanivorans TaxID=441119 RepID=A0A1I5M6R0_9RHOB|nr:GYD domain-containing protein [Tranquillimonas alkanivorans]SFP05190.1 Uncharacterized protein, contains GYD domain [Tranquillimonas alkanivorans]
MPYYLFKGRYTTQAYKALVDTPQDRTAAGTAVVEAAGGKLHNLFFCFGKEDVIALIEMPDDQAMAAAAMTLAASGAFAGGSTTKLLTAQEAKAAMEAAQTVAKSYTPVTG